MFTINDFWKIFNVIKGDDVPNITEVIKSLAKSEKGTTIDFFNKTINQNTFSTDDGIRFKDFLINWYAAHKTITSLQSQITDPFSIPDSHLDELFRSFGYPYSSNKISLPSSRYGVNESKVNLFLDLINLYKIKGTPRSVIEILSYYGLSNTDLYEFWLEKETKNKVIFRGKQTISSTKYTDDYILNFDEMILNDPHWMLTENQVLQLDLNNKINLPSRTPYFAIRPTYDIREINGALTIVSKEIQDQYLEFINTGTILNQNATISAYGKTCSLLELYLSCIYIFNKIYSCGIDPINIFSCYNGSKTDYSEIIEDYNNLTSFIPQTRIERELKLSEFYNLFTRAESSNFIKNKDTAGLVLKDVNLELYNYLTGIYTPNDLELIISLLIDLGDWIRLQIDLTYVNISFIIFGLFTFIEEIKEVVNFFKPYHSRMKSVELIEFNNPLENSIRIDDIFGEKISNTFVDFVESDGDLLDSTSAENCSWSCIDSTSACNGSRRDTYDCGSYYDIGAASDFRISGGILIYNEEIIHETISCLADGTSWVECDYIFYDSTSADDFIWTTGGFIDFDYDGIFDCISGRDICQITVTNI